LHWDHWRDFSENGALVIERQEMGNLPSEEGQNPMPSLYQEEVESVRTENNNSRPFLMPMAFNTMYQAHLPLKAIHPLAL